jgi:hypothetical protein
MALREAQDRLLPGCRVRIEARDRKGLESQGQGGPCLGRRGCNAWGGQVSGCFYSFLEPAPVRQTALPRAPGIPGPAGGLGVAPAPASPSVSRSVLAPHALLRAAVTARAGLPKAEPAPERSLIAPRQAPAARHPPPSEKDFQPDARTHLGESLKSPDSYPEPGPGLPKRPLPAPARTTQSVGLFSCGILRACGGLGGSCELRGSACDPLLGSVLFSPGGSSILFGRVPTGEVSKQAKTTGYKTMGYVRTNRVVGCDHWLPKDTAAPMESPSWGWCCFGRSGRGAVEWLMGRYSKVSDTPIHRRWPTQTGDGSIASWNWIQLR